MRTHVALLRGINVGGRNKLAMADLRQLVSSLGPAQVATYIQSGNVLFDSPQPDPDVLADGIEEALARRLGVSCGVVVLSRACLAAAVGADPYDDEPDGRRVHLVFRRRELGPDELAAVEAAAARARAKGSRDELTAAGRTLYLWTPDGFGRSELASQLGRTAGFTAGTARSRVTARKLLALLGG